MAIMNVVWPITALFGTVLVVWAYFRYGRAMAPHAAPRARDTGMGMDMDMKMHMSGKSQTPFPVMVGKGTLHCGAGCTLGDIAAELLAFFFPAIAIVFGWHWLFAEKIYAVWILDFLFAFGFGIIFQYFAIVPMRNLSPGEGIRAALKADSLSLICWQIGMYGAMYIAQRIFSQAYGHHATADSPVFWFAMQLAMIAGFMTSYPANWWLLRAGIKEKM